MTETFVFINIVKSLECIFDLGNYNFFYPPCDFQHIAWQILDLLPK